MGFVVYSGLWIALIALGLLHAAAAALQVALPPRLTALVALGSFSVYNLDRLRDFAGDARDKPRRGQFVQRNERELGWLSAAAGTAAIVLTVQSGWRTSFLLGAVGLLSLVHPWLKRVPGFKPLYIGLSWMLVVTGLPLIAGGLPVSRGVNELWPLGAAIVANVLACDVADHEAEALWLGEGGVWNLALAIALLGAASLLVLPMPSRTLGLVPLALLLALPPRRRDEHYVALGLDGALLVGAMAALGWMRWLG